MFILLILKRDEEVDDYLSIHKCGRLKHWVILSASYTKQYQDETIPRISSMGIMSRSIAWNPIASGDSVGNHKTKYDPSMIIQLTIMA